MKGVFTIQKTINIDDDLKWHVDDSNNTIQALCQGIPGDLVKASTVIAAMPAFGTFANTGPLIVSFFYTAAKLSLNISDEDIQQ